MDAREILVIQGGQERQRDGFLFCALCVAGRGDTQGGWERAECSLGCEGPPPPRPAARHVNGTRTDNNDRRTGWMTSELIGREGGRPENGQAPFWEQLAGGWPAAVVPAAAEEQINKTAELAND